MATITDSAVASTAMPNELRRAEVNRSLLNTVLKFSQVQSLGRKLGWPDRNVDGLLNANDTIQSSGKAAHSKMSTPQKVHQLLVLRPSIYSSPLTCDRSVLKTLMKMKAITTTVRNSSTDTAEPAPRFTRVTFWR
jgi:hypothetical protein